MLPYRYGSDDLAPVPDLQVPPAIAVASLVCGEIAGDARKITETVDNRNAMRP
jgi:hypothetical protein